MRGFELRQSYLDFFQEKAHQIVDSAPVVPLDDPTILFLNSGMSQFKPYFLGQAKPSNPRIADTQKCIRVSGKHNDLEETGYDTYHHTFFEMLGNWSFGDYYKKEAIEWAWELLTQVWKMPKDRLYVTIFEGDEQVPRDDEAAELWKRCTDIDPEHILLGNRSDNFWMMGDTGPCGPCSEIHIDLTEDKSGKELVNADSPEVMEIWNLVFMQYNAQEDGSLDLLPSTHVDTGMGFERVAAIVECTKNFTDFSVEVSNYDTVVFAPLLQKLQELSGRTYTPGLSSDQDTVAMRVCADHIRMISFAIADGAIPSSDGRGYVVRRLLRRAVRYGRNLGLQKPFLFELAKTLIDHMGDYFQELRRESDKIVQMILAEEKAFHRTLERGLELFEKELEKLSDSKSFPGEQAFKLYDTYGFPLDLTQVLAREKGLEVDLEGFEREMDAQRERARSAQKKHVVLAASEDLQLPTTKFLGYEKSSCEANVFFVDQQKDLSLIVLDQSVFYAQMGGQQADQGRLSWDSGACKVEGVQSKDGVFYHECTLLEGSWPSKGQKVELEIDLEHRRDLERHHSATHLLHWALRKHLGDHVRQQGSLVEPERLRFDFSHFDGVSKEQLRAIEEEINQKILAGEPISWFEIDKEEKPDSVLAFFGDKYQGKVRVVKIGGEGCGELEDPLYDGFSMELCGGTHLRNTAEIGSFRFLHESAIAAGIRRVEAVCGGWSLKRSQDQEDLVSAFSGALGCPSEELVERLQKLLEENRSLKKRLSSIEQSQASGKAKDLLDQVEIKQGVELLVQHLEGAGVPQLRKVYDGLKGSFQGISVLFGDAPGKAFILVGVGEVARGKGYMAGKIVSELARAVGGGGGGRPDMAQAGGKNPEKIPEAIGLLDKILKEQGS